MSPWLGGALLVAAVVLAYTPAFSAGWIWDDDSYVTRNGVLRSLAGLWQIWAAPGATAQYYPLTFTSFWLEYHVWGLWPAGYHAVNVALHAGNALLLWRILSRLGVPGALVAAFLFALHPVQVESVAWVTERKNVLSGAFYLGAMWAYLKGGWALGAGGWPESRASAPGDRVTTPTPANPQPPAPSPWLYAGSLLLFAAALLSKTITCSLPAALLLVAWWRKGRLEWRDVMPLLPMFALGMALAAVTVWMERSHVGAIGADWHLSFLDRCLIASRALWFYLGQLVWPLRLTFVYPRWQIDAAEAAQYVPLLGMAALLVALGLGRRRLGRAPLAALLFFAGTLLPALGFFNVFPMRYSFVADHYQYLACIGPLTLAVGMLAAEASRRQLGRAGAAAAVGVAALLALLTWRQAHIYEDAATLWTDTLEKNPGAWMAHNNLGLLRQNAGDLEAARLHFQAAIAVKADDDFAMNNLGNVLSGLGRRGEAIDQFYAAIAANPRNAEARNNLGGTLAEQGDLERAKAQFAEALRINPRYAEAHNNLANVLAMQGKADESLREYQEALRSDPDYAQAHHNLAVLLAANGQADAALEHMREVVRLEPDDADASFNLGVLLAEQGQSQAAIAAVRRAVEISGKPEHRQKLAELERGGR